MLHFILQSKESKRSFSFRKLQWNDVHFLFSTDISLHFSKSCVWGAIMSNEINVSLDLFIYKRGERNLSLISPTDTGFSVSLYFIPNIYPYRLMRTKIMSKMYAVYTFCSFVWYRGMHNNTSDRRGFIIFFIDIGVPCGNWPDYPCLINQYSLHYWPEAKSCPYLKL